jgi:hypothetical protein
MLDLKHVIQLKLAGNLQFCIYAPFSFPLPFFSSSLSKILTLSMIPFKSPYYYVIFFFHKFLHKCLEFLRWIFTLLHTYFFVRRRPGVRSLPW